jgi:hypothetical protein
MKCYLTLGGGVYVELVLVCASNAVGRHSLASVRRLM